MCCFSIFNRYPVTGGYPNMMFGGSYFMPRVPRFYNCCFGNIGNSLAVGAGIALGVGAIKLVGNFINRYC